MFDLSLAELALIVVAAVVFIGPKELPVVLRAVAKGMKALRKLTKELRAVFDDISREAGIKETADAMHYEIRMIKGDDGNYYESYQPNKPAPKPAPTPAE
jgi:Sec-independent protein translocase protein TatA